MKNAIGVSLAGLGLGAILACSGGGGDSGATRLAYADPASGEYRLEAAGGSGTDTLVLALRGPSSVSARGVNFGLRLGAKADFARQEGGDYARPGSALDLGGAPRIFRAALDGGSLRVSMAQKGNAVPARPLGGDIATVQVRLQAGAAKGAVPLEALEAKVLLADGRVEPVQVSVGTLEAQ
jgi:hypothetical protein